MDEGWTPPEGERALGLGFYLTRTPGLMARYKLTAEDFRVTEISAHPIPDPEGAFTVLRIESRNWEQHELSRRLARELRLPPNAIRWAGTKDRRAVAERLASYRGAPPRGPIEIPGVDVREVYRARDGLVLGHHFGNAFDIRLSFAHVGRPTLENAAAATLEELRRQNGLPNLFGPQRFGEVRPVTHAVGRALLAGKVSDAVEVYLTAIPPGDDTLGVEARRAYAQHHDPARALHEFPPQFSFERQMLEHLARGHSPDRAFRSLARELRLLFVHAYQSLLYNRWVTERWRSGLSLVEPVEGDLVLRVGRDGTVSGTDPVPVDSSNLAEVRETVRRGGARLAGPLIGYATPDLPGPGGDLANRLLAEEGVTRRDFLLPATPELASAGSSRPVWVNLPPIASELECTPARPAEEEDGIRLRFALPKGTYATILLREFLKSGATTRSG